MHNLPTAAASTRFLYNHCAGHRRPLKTGYRIAPLRSKSPSTTDVGCRAKAYCYRASFPFYVRRLRKGAGTEARRVR
ncbi:hypothetical protein E2542_SST20917 [Spatholobus suberectus]|nr:hypothetical protein E2542_SST20917 [Spatholobus suberectus]